MFKFKEFMVEAKKPHDDTEEDKALIKKMVKPSALKEDELEEAKVSNVKKDKHGHVLSAHTEPDMSHSEMAKKLHQDADDAWDVGRKHVSLQIRAKAKEHEKLASMKESEELDEVYHIHTKGAAHNAEWSHNKSHVFSSIERAKQVASNIKKGTSTQVKIVKHTKTPLAGPKGKLPESVEVVEASTGNAFDWKSYTSDRKGVGVHGQTKTYHDVKKTSTGTVYTKQVDSDGTSKGSGDDAAKKAETAEQPKRGRGRPKGVGAKAGQYKPRDPAKKAASAAKAAATKAANRKARNEEFNQEFIQELMDMLVEDYDVEEFMDLLQEEQFDEFYVTEIEAIEEACKSKKKKAPVTESTVSKYANFLNK